MLSFFRRKYKEVIRYRNGTMFYEFGNDSKFTKFDCVEDRIEYALSNPVLMLVLKARCDLYSLVKINKYSKDGAILETDFLHSKVGNANYFQTWEQFHWEFCLWESIMSAYVYTPSHKKLDKGVLFYNLRPQDIKIKSDLRKKLSKLIIQDSEYNKLMNENIYYRDGDMSENLNNYTTIPLRFIKPFHNTTNGVNGNWFESFSMIDSMSPILDNAIEVLKTQNTNLRYSGKFQGTKGDAKLSLTDLNNSAKVETESIENSIESDKNFYALKHQFNIQRFVDSIANLKLDEQQVQQYFFIGKMYGMPKDFLEASLKGTTYENKDASFGQVVSQSLQPLVDKFTSWIEEHFGEEDVRGSWSHLPFMEQYEEKKQTAITTKLNNINLAQQNGAQFTPEELRKMTREAIQ